MKKNITVLLLFISILLINASRVNADTSEASLRGFDIYDFDYVADEANDLVEIRGSKYYYGEIGLWTAIYKYYSNEEDKMIYAVLIEGSINATTEKNVKRSFSAKRMDFDIKFDSNYARLVTYSPQPELNDYSVTTSYGNSLEYDPTIGAYLSPSITYSLTETFDEISQYIDENDNSVLLRFNFSRYANNVRGIPYQGTYRQQATVFFAVDDYSTNYHQMAGSQIVINYDGYIFKDTVWWAGSNFTDDESINDTYKYTNNGNFI